MVRPVLAILGGYDGLKEQLGRLGERQVPTQLRIRADEHAELDGFERIAPAGHHLLALGAELTGAGLGAVLYVAPRPGLREQPLRRHRERGGQGADPRGEAPAGVGHLVAGMRIGQRFAFGRPAAGHDPDGHRRHAQHHDEERDAPAGSAKKSTGPALGCHQRRA